MYFYQRKEGVSSLKANQDLPGDERPQNIPISNFQKPVYTTNSTCNQQNVIQCTIESLHQQLQWASEMLPQLSSIDGRIQICNLIKVTSETLREIRSLAEPS